MLAADEASYVSGSRVAGHRRQAHPLTGEPDAPAAGIVFVPPEAVHQRGSLLPAAAS